MKIAKGTVGKIPLPLKGQTFYRDNELKGFGVYAGKTAKTYFVEKWMNGKAIRVTIEKHGPITAEQARKKAQELLGQMSVGNNPLDSKKEKRARSVTLKQAYQDFKDARKNLKPKTLYDYDRIMEVALKTWHKKRIAEITKDMVAKLHKKLGEERGEAYANLTMRFFRSLINFAAGQYEDSKGHSLIPENPVKRLSQTRAWYKMVRRDTVIKTHELQSWHKAVNDLESPTIRDYLLLLLFTGLRRQEAAKLKWEQVDFSEKTLSICETKNSQTLTLPLTNYLIKLLQERQAASTSEYVFPGDGEKSQHLVEPRYRIKQVIKASGIKFSIHDLRRTFITTAERLNISTYAVKRLVNHKMNGDVTAGYIITDVERLREPMQKITDEILRLTNTQQQ